MLQQILATKIYMPAPRPHTVSRARLSDQLDAGLHGKLTLVSAPAGFGKTTVVTEWITAVKRPTAWLSLDEDDSNPVRFLRYIIAALQTIAPEMGKSILNVLESSQPSITSLLIPLLNEFAMMPHEMILVLDDYHMLDSKEIDQALAFLIDNQPSQMHLVITTREDPQLPLPRYRARAELTELRASDLRFTLDEATEFLNRAMGLSLMPDDINALTARTEGWIAGLQLASISLQPQENPADFIQSFTGSHHFVLDYLVEEVLNRQPPHIQDFLIKTSMLNRLCAPLCDAIIQDREHSSQTLLRDIQQANLFLVALDNERHWFRYHHLFADLLRKRLGQLASTEINSLHIRASHWYEQHNQRADAIYHALTAQNFELAAEMIEREWASSRSTTIQNRKQRAWMQALPESVYRNRPVLSAAYGWVLLNYGQIDAADLRLRDAEYWLDLDGQPGDVNAEMIVIDETEFQRLPLTVASARTYYALALGNIPATIHYGQRVLALAAENEHHQRGIVTSLMGLAYWWNGDLASAYQFLAEGLAYMHKLGNVQFVLSNTFGLADVRLGQGRLCDAIAIYERGLQIAEAQPFVIQGLADMYVGLGELYREQNNLDSARDYISKSETLGEQAGLPNWRVRFCKIKARMMQTMGEFDEALELLDEAEQLYYPTPLPDIQPIPATRARVWIQQGQITSALSWAQDRQLAFDSDVRYLNEFDLVTLARIHIALVEEGNDQSSTEKLTHLLERLLDVAEADKRMGSVIEISILQARFHWMQGNREVALTALKRALQLAEPEGYVRVFVDEGWVMKTILSEAIAQDIAPTYSRQLLMAFENFSENSRPSQPLIEPLSGRELEILQLVANGLSNREVSQRLFITVNTVKGHNRNIYQKLQVKRRTEAVARAQELGLI